MKIHCEYTRLVPISELKPHPKNPKKHTPEAIERQAQVMDYQGWRRPCTVSNRSGLMTAGHKRTLAAKLRGVSEVPVSFQDYDSEEQEIADLVADNALNEWELTDLGAVNAMVADLGPDFDINLLGIKDFVIEPADKYGDGEGEDDVPDAPIVAHSRVGDLFILGTHRLIIGDCTEPEVIGRLMGDDLASLYLTDPPYGVSYIEKNAAVHGGIVKNAVGKQITNDTLSLDECTSLWGAAARNAYDVCNDQASYYWFACQGGDQMMMMMMMSISDANWKVRHELIWVKPSMVFGRCDYHYRHEPILYGWKKDGTHKFYSDRKQTSVLEFERPHKSDLHPTTKPSALIEYLLGNSSKPKDVVLDTFGGSGTTLIACEKMGRECRMSEIDPIYGDVILDRFAKFSGIDPIREDGVPWSKIKADGATT